MLNNCSNNFAKVQLFVWKNRVWNAKKTKKSFSKEGKIFSVKEKIGIKKTIQEYGIEEKEFLSTLDEMTEQAFDDQCTGANPRYPLMSEIKQMYLNAYYGEGGRK